MKSDENPTFYVFEPLLSEREGFQLIPEDWRIENADSDFEPLLDGTLEAIVVIEYAEPALRTGVFPISFIGSNAADTQLGTSLDDTMDGMGGDDFFKGRGGSDRLLGGDGNDILKGQAGGDFLEGGSGRDELFGGGGSDSLRGDGGRDFLAGQAGADNIFGGDGNDLMRGGNGHDVMNGQGGRDKLYGGKGNDRMSGDDGNDKLYDSPGDDVMFGGNGNDEFIFGLIPGRNLVYVNPNEIDMIRIKGWLRDDQPSVLWEEPWQHKRDALQDIVLEGSRADVTLLEGTGNGILDITLTDAEGLEYTIEIHSFFPMTVETAYQILELG